MVVDATVESERLGPGQINHALTLEANRGSQPIWKKEIYFRVDAPFDVPDLETVDPFVIAALFPAMEVGGTLRIHGRVSRTLIRNILDFQSAWHMAAPEHCRMFALDVKEVADLSIREEGTEPDTILAFTAGVDAMLALCRNVSGDAGPAAHKIGATMMILGMHTETGEVDGEPLIADLRRISGDWGLPMAVVDSNIVEIVRRSEFSHGTWLAACLMLFAGNYSTGLLGSSKLWFKRGWEVFGSHPLLDPLLSGGQMTIRNDEGLYHRAEKVKLLTLYPGVVDELRVCWRPFLPERNCCRCEKCVRTMLCFVANGEPIPAAFPEPLSLREIGNGMGRRAGLQWVPGILDCAERNGTSDEKAIRVLRRRYRFKRLKVFVKLWLKALRSRKRPHKWYVLDSFD